MAAIASLSDLVTRCTGGSSGTPQNLFWYKDSRVGAAAAAATVIGKWSSLWQYDGSPSDGAAPGAVAIPTNSTSGALKQASPGGGRQQWLLGMTAAPSTTGTLVLYDRLLHISGLSGTNTGAQTVQSAGVPALTRYTNGSGNQIWIEIYTQIGASSTTITASYTNQSGNSATTAAAAIGNTNLREAQRMIPLTLAQGDTGVQGVASVTLNATTGTAGDFGVTVMQPILTIPCTLSGVGIMRDLVSGLPGPKEIASGACLAWAWLAGTTSAPQLFGSVHLVEA